MIHGILNALSSKYAKDLNVSRVYISYIYKGFWIKYFMVNIWQGFEYTPVSKYARVVNVLGFWICQGSLRNR